MSGPVMLVGRKASNGAQVIFCLADHEWVHGPPAACRGWASTHALQVHGFGPPSFVEIPKGVPYRPFPVDRVGQ